MGQSIQQTVVWGFAVAMYLLFAYPLFVMGNKTGSNNSWFAFVPILNFVLLCEIAGKEWWWVLLLLIPCVNIIISVILWMGAAEAMEKPSWLGVLMLIPGVNLFVPFYLALG